MQKYRTYSIKRRVIYYKLFTVPYFSVRSSRSSYLPHGRPSNPDARPLGTCETQTAARTGKLSILTILRKIGGLWTVYIYSIFCISDAAFIQEWRFFEGGVYFKITFLIHRKQNHL